MTEAIQKIELRYESAGIRRALNAGGRDAFFSFNVVQNGSVVNFEIIPLNTCVLFTLLSVNIEFTQAIRRWRNHNYHWASLETDRIANEYAPKILQLCDGTYAQAAQINGCWEVGKSNPNTLRWHFHTPGLRPVFYFNPHRVFYQPGLPVSQPLKFQLLFTQKNPVE